jgi:hypothetical protein
MLKLLCVGWPIQSQDRPRKLNITNQIAPTLLVSALYDPATSFEWAVSVQEQTPNSILMARNGTGHTSYQVKGESAARIDQYLINLTMPGYNTVVQT